MIPNETVQRLLAGVVKPARYTGGEVNSVVKRQAVRCRMALCFPDIYEVAESHLGFKILYDIINRVEDLAAERCYAWWPDLEQQARAEGVPLWSLETYRPLCAFDLIGFTLQHELSYTMVVTMLELGGVPVRAGERGNDDPIVIAGGAGAFNPEPIADFLDAVLLGDGEEAVVGIMDTVAEGRRRGATRAAILNDLGALPGVYVPSHYEIDYDGLQPRAIRALAGSPKAALTTRHGTPRVTRVVAADLDALPYPERTIVPNVGAVHERATVEIQRGCSRSCRFCQAGMTTRPTRQRSPDRIISIADTLLDNCGCDEVGLLSLSAGDYPSINELLVEFFRRHAHDQVNISLPSLRTETMTPELAEQVATVRKGGFTLAPEAGSERLRAVINKTNRDEDLLNAVRAATEAGWRLLKIYFMIGLPTETDEDIDAIVDLALEARRAGRQVRSDFNVTVSVSTFIPKPHTPFQWEGQLDMEETRRLQRHLAQSLRRHKIALRYHAADQSFLEGVLCRGDRRLGPAIEAAARLGCRFDAWSEHHDHATWNRALHETLAPHGLEAADYLRPRSLEQLLPWSHLDAGVLDKFLRRDRRRALAGQTVADCAFDERCYACGACDIADPYLDRSAPRRAESQLRPRLHRDGPTATTEAAPAPELPEERSRFRFRFSKQGRALHLSHLATMEHVLRAVRAAKMPAVYSRGFTPRPRVSFSPACPTGITSEAEFFEVNCHDDGDEISAARWADRLTAFLPDGLAIRDAARVDPKGRSVNDLICTMTYQVARPDSMSAESLRSAVARFGANEQCWVRVTRKRKPRILDACVQLTEVTCDEDSLRITVAFADHGTLKVREAVGVVLGPEHAGDLVICKTDVELAADRPERVDARRAPEAPEVDVLDLSRLGEHAPTRRNPSPPAQPSNAH